MADARTPISSSTGSPRSSSRRRSILRRRHDLECSYCQRLFAKPEHLKRHEQTHIGLKSYACPVCNKTFGRQDSLKRHARTHMNQATQPSTDSVIQRGGTPIDLRENDDDHTGLLTLARATAQHAHHIDLGQAELTPTFQQSLDAFDGEAESGTERPRQQFEAAINFQNLSADSTLDTPWPGSVDLLQMLVNADAGWPIDFQMPFVSIDGSSYDGTSRSQPTHEGGSYVRAHQAMRQMSNLIQDLSFNLAKEVESTGVTSDFLENCMNTFFDHFVLVFPVIHQPTFSLKDCASPLLLNMIALGSLFVATDEAVNQGEALWRLAHTAVATSWQSMMDHLSHGDMTTGVQLVMTALLGQSYAVLSRSRSSRLTSHVFHGLGFYWARQCGMPVTHPFTDVPSIHSSPEEKRRKWKAWAAQETRHRALLGHYILDGLISQSSGLPTSDRHLTNTTILPSNAAVYMAQSADEWIEAMQAHPPPSGTFCDIYRRLFDPQTAPDVDLSPFAIRVVLEGLQSLVSDRHQARGPSVGSPDSKAVSAAMWRIYDSQITSTMHAHDQKTDLLLRWHAIGIELCVDTNWMIRHLCETYAVRQELYSGRGDTFFDIPAWSNTRDARQAILHASAILDAVTSLPFGRMQSIHVPFAVFTSSIIFLALSLNGSTKAAIPQDIDWYVVHVAGSDPVCTTRTSISTHSFLDLAHDIWNPPNSVRSFLYKLNTLQKVLESLSSTWGIVKDMQSILQSLLAEPRLLSGP